MFQLIPEKAPGIIDHRNVMPPFQEPPHQMTSGESGTAGYQTFPGLHQTSCYKNPSFLFSFYLLFNSKKFIKIQIDISK
jgi:hypothetical protein